MMKIGVSLRYYIFEPPISISVCDFFFAAKNYCAQNKRVEFFFICTIRFVIAGTNVVVFEKLLIFFRSCSFFLKNKINYKLINQKKSGSANFTFFKKTETKSHKIGNSLASNYVHFKLVIFFRATHFQSVTFSRNYKFTI